MLNALRHSLSCTIHFLGRTVYSTLIITLPSLIIQLSAIWRMSPPRQRAALCLSRLPAAETRPQPLSLFPQYSLTLWTAPHPLGNLFFCGLPAFFLRPLHVGLVQRYFGPSSFYAAAPPGPPETSAGFSWSGLTRLSVLNGSVHPRLS